MTKTTSYSPSEAQREAAWEALPSEARPRMLDMSTAHLKPKTMNAMSAWRIEEGRAPVPFFGHTHNGWIVWVPDPDWLTNTGKSGDLPADLLACLWFAHWHGANYLLLDSDGYHHPSLPQYDEDGNTKDDEAAFQPTPAPLMPPERD